MDNDFFPMDLSAPEPRDADEAWSLALAFLEDEEAAREAAEAAEAAERGEGEEGETEGEGEGADSEEKVEA